MSGYAKARGAHFPAQRRTSEDGDWRTQGACTREDPDLHFPDGTTGPALLQIASAKAVCRACPVAERCLQLAIDTRPAHGIWGGLDPDELRSLRRRTTRKAAA